MYLDEGAHLDHVDTVINIGKQNIIHQSQGEDLKPTTPWNLPNSVDSFTGREEELKDLKSALTKDGKSFISQNIVGLSGIGKTSLAVEYAWRNKEDYDFIAFIKASSQDSLTNDFKELGIMFRFQEQQPIRNIIQFVYRKLSEYRSVLLIFDDAESLSIIRGQGLETGSNCNFEVPQIYNNKIHWLVTTKNQNFSDKSVIKLKEFSLDEARSYIKDRIPDLSKDDLLLVESLAITLGRFPLALSYATAYIKQNKDLDFSILKYLDLYKTQEEERKKLLSLKIETELHIPVYNTWQISIRALEKHQKSIEILKYCACLAPEIIPLSFIKLIINTDSEIEFNEALQELKKYSFIEIQEFQREGSIKGIIVHSLLQEVIRLDLKEQYNIKLNFIVSKIQETYPTNKKQMSDYSFAIMLIPHLNVLIKKNKENILLLQMTADAYDCLGNYNEQKELLEEALAIKVKHYQTREHIDVAGTLNNLGNAYGSLGNYNKQKELLEEVLDIKVKHYQTREHIDVAMTLDNLGNAYGRLGNYNKKKELLEEALAIKVKHYQTREHIDVAGTLNNLGNAYGSLGNYNKQKELLEEALDIKVKHYQTREHIDVATMLNNLGNAYGSLGNYNKKKELLEEALAIKVKHYQTREHIDVAMTLDNLGNAYGRLGNYNKKKELLEEALAIKVKHYQTREHIDVAGTLNNLGNAYGSLGNYNKQKELLEEALDIKVKHYQTREHIDAAGTLNNLGNAYGSLGNYNKQKELLEEVLAIQIKHHKTREHIDVATTLDNLGNAYGNLGNYNKKKELLEEALAIKVKHYQTREHIDVAITMASLAQVYSVKNDFQQALKLIENAYQILQEYLKRGENHPFIKRVLNIKQKIEKAALSIAPDTWLRFRLEKLEKKSDDEETHLALGDYYMHIEDINNAIAHYEKIVALLPEQALADHNLACCYNVRGQEEDKALAVKHFERAIALKPTSSVFCEYGHFLYQLFNKTIPINRGLLEETTLQLIQAINLADDTIINYGNLEKPVIEEYLQRLIGEQGEIIIKPSCLAYYLLIKSYFILGHYVDAKQSLDNFEKHLVNLFNISADGSSNNLQIEHLLLDKIKGEYITKHKHKDARMQHEYDKRFGLIVWHSTTRKAQKFSEATLKAISQDKEKYSLFYKVVTEYDMEALDVLMAAGLVNLQEPFLKSTMLHMCLQKFTISIGKFISNDCKLSENPTQKVCDVIDLLFEKADANIKNGQEETPLQIIDRFCPVVVEEIHNEEFNACKQKLLGYANRYHSTEVNNHNEILVSKIKLKFSGKYAQTYFPISEKYAYLPEIANKNLEDKPINLFNKYKR